MVTENEIINKTNDTNLKNLYEYLKEKILNLDDDIYITQTQTYINFKIEGIAHRNLVSFGFKKNYIEFAFHFKPTNDDNTIFNQCRLKGKEGDHRVFIVSDKGVNITPTKSHPNPKKIILKITKKNGETYYNFENKAGIEFPVDDIVNFIKQHYNELIQKL